MMHLVCLIHKKILKEEEDKTFICHNPKIYICRATRDKERYKSPLLCSAFYFSPSLCLADLFFFLTLGNERGELKREKDKE